MPELGYQSHSSARSSGLRARDASPDSVIYTLESNFSLFSSASASVDRCSFASDAHDRESLASDISLQLAGHDREHQERSSGPDLDPNKPAVHTKHGRLSRKREKVKVQKVVNNEADFEDLDQTLDSARNSFSLTLKGCEEMRSRSEAFPKKPDRRRPASVDLNNVNTYSPRFGMIKSSTTARGTGTFPSPGTPTYQHTGVGMQKGWSSERVPLHNNAGRRHVSTALLPYSNGRALPSKWEDAERWICSPVSAEGPLRAVHPQPHTRPKSKSGPLGAPGADYCSFYSTAANMYDGRNLGPTMENSPFSAGGAIAGDGLTIQSCGHSRAFPLQTACMARSASVHGCSETPGQSILPPDSNGKGVGFKDAATLVSRSISRRDMATQMSPEGSTHSSPDMRASFSTSTPSVLPTVEMQSSQPSKMEVRDVQVDGRVTVTRWSKKNKIRIPRKNSEAIDNWKQKGESSAWDVSEAAKSISKVTREEARITAWENLQKAKAEAAIRKLEMKLEKKRSSSMDKIMNKLRLAQKRAQEMRSSVLASQAHQVARPSHKAVSFRTTPQMSSLSGCFTCHAF